MVIGGYCLLVAVAVCVEARRWRGKERHGPGAARAGAKDGLATAARNKLVDVVVGLGGRLLGELVLHMPAHGMNRGHNQLLSQVG